MGYYTDYSLTYDVSPLLTPEQRRNIDLNIEEVLLTQLEKQTDYIFTDWGGALKLHGKWYDFENDMKAISQKWPHILFQLEAHGEESGDIWKMYFMNGKSQYCESYIIFDKFDPTKLK